ncbi:MAG: AMP-binding protein [Burkholderiales bacterium]|nr:AMP-binding protein [Burkholderiales bacterium]
MHACSEASQRAAARPLDWIAPQGRLHDASSTRYEPAHALIAAVEALARRLRAELAPRSVVGLLADNSPTWVVAELAVQAADMVVVPLPLFFSPEQLRHAIDACGMQALFSADTRCAAGLGFQEDVLDAGVLTLARTARTNRTTVPIAPAVSKITFTSGTTGAPKGVLLTMAQQLDTARGLATLLQPLGIRRHLSLLPLPVLLENVAGVYSALMLGAECVCPALYSIGLQGASAFAARTCLEAIERNEPESVIVLPQMLQALVGELTRRTHRPRFLDALRFVAVGGARTAPALLTQARALGLPVYEGYGLSECASVVSVNVPGADCIGSVGRPLPGVHVRLAPDGEIEIAGRGYAGYLGVASATPASWLRTGDLGVLDADGFLAIAGRKKDVIVTSFGRNVSPEWPEALLLEHPAIAQAVVCGDERPFLAAVLATRAADATIDAVIARANARLPDYARIGGWVRASAPFTAANGLATANGRIRRAAVAQFYEQALVVMYAKWEGSA